MKSLFVILTLVAGAQLASATSLYEGPFVSLTLTQKAQNKFITCNVTPAGVTILKSTGWKMFRENKINRAEMETAITLANRAPYSKIAVHVAAANPRVDVVAGLPPKIDNFQLFTDASAVYQRHGKDASQLIKLVKQSCGNLRIDF